MPRVFLPKYPQQEYQTQSFPISDSNIHDYKQYCNASDEIIVGLWQKWGLVHSHCPEKRCGGKYACVYHKGNDCVRCEYCKTDYPSRPDALRYLHGSHKEIFERLFIFSSGDCSNEFLHNFQGDYNMIFKIIILVFLHHHDQHKKSLVLITKIYAFYTYEAMV